MKTQEFAPVKEDQKQIQLIKGEFTPSEANEIIGALIDQKINFHEVRKFQRWEGNHDSDIADLNTRIAELKKDKQTSRDFIRELQGSNHKVRINGVLEITVTDTETEL